MTSRMISMGVQLRKTLNTNEDAARVIPGHVLRGLFSLNRGASSPSGAGLKLLDHRNGVRCSTGIDLGVGGQEIQMLILEGGLQ